MEITFPESATYGCRVTIQEPHPKDISPDEYFDALCVANPTMRIERSSSGNIVFMAPTGFETGYKNNEISRQLADWARRDGSGLAADSSTVFRLPNGANRSPDASWIAKERLVPLTREEKRGFLPLCPDFVVELRSPSDHLPDLREKMNEWIAQGARLGWLINPDAQWVEIYRPNLRVETLQAPKLIEGDGPVSGFVLDLTDVWSEI